MKKCYVLLAGLMLAAGLQTQAQTKIGGAGAPDNSAMLEVTGGTGNNKGILPPKLTTAQRDGIANPATGLMIYNTTANQLQVNTGTAAAPVWTASASGSSWTTSGNAGTTAGTNFIGTTDTQTLAFKVNNQDKMRLTDIGLVVGDTAMIITDPSNGTRNGGINLVNNGGTTWDDDITIQSFSVLPGAGLLMYAAHGTKAAPQRMLGGQDIGAIHFRGRRTNDWGATASIVATTVGDSAHLGTQLRLATSNASAGNDGVVIDSAAHLGIGTASPATDLHTVGQGVLISQPGTADRLTNIQTQFPGANLYAKPFLILDGGLEAGKQMGIYFRDATDTSRQPVKFDYSASGIGFHKTLRNGLLFTQNMVTIGENDTTAVRLYVDHQIQANGIVLTSDQRVKTNIRAIGNGLSTIMRLEPKLYDKYNYSLTQEGLVLDRNRSTPEFGFIAQEVDKILPGIVQKPNKQSELYAVNYIQLIPILTQAVQEQQAQIETLKAENKKLKANEVVITQLIARVKQMEQMMGINEIEGTSKVAGK